MNRSMQKIAFVILASISCQASAMSVDWTGNYRFEYTEVDKTSLDSPGLRKAYILNHLSLSPKIIAADGVNIVGKFEILPNDQYPDSQAGQAFGKGPSKAATNGASSSKDDSAVAGNKQGSSTIQVSQLYLNLNQEYGALLVGRAPLEFGLGITHSAGNGAFDHWYDTHDMIGYKVLVGNLSIMPIFGRVYDYSVSQGRDVQDMIWDVEYNNAETESAIGIMHQTRTANLEANDAPAAALGGSTGVVNGYWKTQHVNVFIARGFEAVKIRVEAGFESGSTGVTRGTEGVNLGGYGLAFEADFPKADSRWHSVLRMGMASGDNPSTANYEGFHFSRNYDVAFLLFNHPLGRYDLLRSGAQRSSDRRASCATAPCSPYSSDEALDEEVISNATFISPKFDYSMSDKWEWTNRVTWAQLQTNPLSDQGIDVTKDLGFEWDTGFVYRPNDKIQWVNEIGLLFPGAAWQGGTRDYGKSFTYGFSSKAAITF